MNVTDWWLERPVLSTRARWLLASVDALALLVIVYWVLQ